ncbi:hypothetical protein P0Y35_01745 [Kiritimatiellaeota bacterium B1221]|nr:hypothetical protein [Kiritimatiellaeota bacterium B1221]
MRFLCIFFFTVCSLGILPLWAASQNDQYTYLQKEYRKALTKVDKGFEQQLIQLKKDQVAQAKAISQNYRDEGNISYHLEAKNYARYLEDNEIERMDWDRVQNAQLKEFHQQMLQRTPQLYKETEQQKYLVMNRMATLLEKMIQENASDPAFTQILKADLAQIQNDPNYIRMQNQAEQQQEARDAARSRRAAATPIPLPTALPFNDNPRIELDVFRKKTDRNIIQFHPIMLKIQLRSKEMRREYENISVQVWFIDRIRDSRKDFIINRVEKLNIKELGLGQVAEVETDIVRETPFVGRQQINREFYGYVVVAKDSKGKTLAYKAYPSRFEAEDRAEKVMAQNEGGIISL